ncbi:MAG: VOC family protein, partial [Synechococcaceae bacterium WB6_1B_055]|nr:VOC family protein [Synechococcaceae bacterium WB6_1B_055]
MNWYCETLGFSAGKREILEGEWLNELIGMPNAVIDRAKLHLGDEEIELWEFQSSTGIQNNNFQSEVIPVDSKSNDLWFQHICIVVKDIEKAFT